MAKSSAPSSSKKAAAAAAVGKPTPVTSSSEASSDETSSDSESGSDVEVEAPKKAAEVPFSTRYTPPEGYKLDTSKPGKSEFDWDTIKNAPAEQLWVIKVPKGFKGKYLEGMEISLPDNLGTASSASSSSHSQAVGSFSRKGLDYDAFIVADLDGERASQAKKAKDKGKKKRTHDEQEQIEDDEEEFDFSHGGQEMRSLVPLLPKHSDKNKLHAAPRPLSLALSIALRPPPSVLPNSSTLSSLIASQPSPVPGAVLSAEELLDPAAIQQKKKVRTQPAGLRMRLQLPGTRSVEVSEEQLVTRREDRMEVDTEAEEVASALKGKKSRTEEERREKKEKKEKKKEKKVKKENA